MATDLAMAFIALNNKKQLYDSFWNYYEGAHPLVYSSERLRDIFDNIKAGFTQNWCAVVVDSTLDRIQFRQFTVSAEGEEAGSNEVLEKRLGQIVEANELELESDDVHLAALVTGESFVIAEATEDGPRAYYNDPRMCHAFYEADNPRRIRFAAKWWLDAEFYCRLNLYYADRIEYYVTRSKVTTPDGLPPTIDNSGVHALTNASAFMPADPPMAENLFSRINVFHFRREHRAIRSELLNVIQPQDALNKLLNDMMIAAEFGAFKQRWIITAAGTDKLKNAPSEIWNIPPASDGEQPTQLGEFASTDLDNYITGIDKFANAIAIITRTPKHYFVTNTQTGDPSGEALIAMEAPLNKKCQKYIDRFSSTWQQLGAFLLELDGAPVAPGLISPTFDKPETVQPRTEAEIREINVRAGIPLLTTLRDDGWTDAEIAKMQRDKEEEQSAQQAQLGAALVGAMRGFDQGGGNGAGDNGATGNQPISNRN